MEGGIESRKWLHSGRVRPMTGKPSLKIESPNREDSNEGIPIITQKANAVMSNSNVFTIDKLEFA